MKKPNKEKTRQQINKDISIFLKKGGKINKVPFKKRSKYIFVCSFNEMMELLKEI